MKIIHLTDFHLFKDKNEKLHGHCTYEGLRSVIDFILSKNFMNAIAAFITGDISHDESVESYQTALNELSRLNLPLYFIPGNHDEQIVMDAVLKASSSVHSFNELTVNDWVFIPVNTVKYGEDSGFVSQNQLDRIENEILKNKNHKISLVMHHHPVPVGIPLVDDCMLMNGNDILNLCDKYSAVKSVICGHAHTHFCREEDGYFIDVCPATCFQWTEGATVVKTKDERGFNLISYGESYKSETFFL